MKALVLIPILSTNMCSYYKKSFILLKHMYVLMRTWFSYVAGLHINNKVMNDITRDKSTKYLVWYFLHTGNEKLLVSCKIGLESSKPHIADLHVVMYPH